MISTEYHIQLLAPDEVILLTHRYGRKTNEEIVSLREALDLTNQEFSDRADAFGKDTVDSLWATYDKLVEAMRYDLMRDSTWEYSELPPSLRDRPAHLEPDELSGQSS